MRTRRRPNCIGRTPRRWPWRWPATGVATWAVFLSACMAQSVVVVGETPIPPAERLPTVAVRVHDDQGIPIVGAAATAGESRVVSDSSGLLRVRWQGETLPISVEAEGFFPAAVAVDGFQEEPFELTLRPVVLRGAVIDGARFGLPAASVSLGDSHVITDRSGRFEIVRALAGTVFVNKPGWHDTEYVWDGETLVIEIETAPKIIRALHIAFNVFREPGMWQELLEVADETVVNALVIDVKDESGRVFYDTGVELAHRVNAVDELYDLDQVIAEMDRRGLYKIARVVTFQDPISARREPELAIYDSARGQPFRMGDQFFLDPTDPGARSYALDLAEEVCLAGFDEIQFDYVRYPDGYPKGFPDYVRFDLGGSPDMREAVITGFLQEAADRLHPHGCVVAADIFGFITSARGDGGIGQELGVLSRTIDVISPMLYPSHYSKGWFGLDRPNDHPGVVVSEALADGIERLEGAAVIRPWLQDFYYTPSGVREQIEAAEDQALGWMLWNSRSRFQIEALDAEPEAGSDGLDAGTPVVQESP
ncbi:MAG: hypothetical protein OXF41_15940 [bacterium]|nr:hypothetical protein [bacterium]